MKIKRFFNYNNMVKGVMVIFMRTINLVKRNLLIGRRKVMVVGKIFCRVIVVKNSCHADGKQCFSFFLRAQTVECFRF